MLDNIFLPMFEATLDPEGHPKLAKFLTLVSAFDSVDDESKSANVHDRTFSSLDRTPDEWDIGDNPSYKYYNYFMYSNLRVLNRLRAAMQLSQFNYRPHAGEAGELHHLDAAFLLADSIAHGINLRHSMPLQYLYYICKVGLAMSPCSNNHLFLSYGKHPFKDFFARGLNLSLSTDDPLMFHQTKEPLMEEYSLAKQFFRLSSADLCELARNSVLQSGFPPEDKATWLGSSNPNVNDITKSNVPDSRLAFRRWCHQEEMQLLSFEKCSGGMKAFCKGIPRFLGLGEENISPRRKRPSGDGNDPSPQQVKQSFVLLPIAPEAAEGVQCPDFLPPPAVAEDAISKRPACGVCCWISVNGPQKAQRIE
jgi:AMP deaminase